MSRAGDADELDELIEARRGGEPVAPGADGESLYALAELAADLEVLARQVELPDEGRVWREVQSELTRVEPGGRRWLDDLVRPLRRVPPRLAWSSAVGVAVAVVIAGLGSLVVPESTSAAFVREVETLSATAALALEDDVLTEEERRSVSQLTASLLERVDREPATLIAMNDDERAEVLLTLGGVVTQLAPIATDEIAASRSAELIETAGLSPGAADEPAEAQAPPGDGVGAGEALAAPIEPTQVTSNASIASSVSALRGVGDAVASAQPGQEPDFVTEWRAAQGRLPTAGEPTGGAICSGLAGAAASGCEQAIVGATAACASVSGDDGLEACRAAVVLGSAVCGALLAEGDANVCARALESLLEAAERGWAGAEVDEDEWRHDGRDRENITPFGRRDR